MAAKFRVRRRAAVLAGSLLLATGLPFTLSACGSDAPPAGQQASGPALVSVGFSSALADALETQVQAQAQAATQDATQEAAQDAAVCTTDPADRSACRNPSGTIDPNGGDVDGDGIFEPHEPVGPGYKDPRAYDGGKTSGETQCEWLRSRGIAC